MWLIFELGCVEGDKTSHLDPAGADWCLAHAEAILTVIVGCCYYSSLLFT